MVARIAVFTKEMILNHPLDVNIVSRVELSPLNVMFHQKNFLLHYVQMVGSPTLIQVCVTKLLRILQLLGLKLTTLVQNMDLFLFQFMTMQPMIIWKILSMLIHTLEVSKIWLSWVDGSPFDYENFENPNPGTINYLSMNKVNGKWDESDDDVKGFICQRNFGGLPSYQWCISNNFGNPISFEIVQQNLITTGTVQFRERKCYPYVPSELYYVKASSSSVSVSGSGLPCMSYPMDGSYDGSFITGQFDINTVENGGCMVVPHPF